MVDVEIFEQTMLEETRQSHPVVRQMWLLANDDNIVFSPFGVEFEEFLAAKSMSVLSLLWRT